MAEGAVSCSSCGTSTAQAVGGGAAAAPAPVPASAPRAGGLQDNLAGLLCYSPVGLIADLVFLLAEPYNRNRFIRFHAFQSLFTAVAMIVLAIALSIIGMIIGLIPVVGWIVGLLLWMVFGVGNLVLWVVLMIKAYQMQMFKLPFIGDLAEKQANA